MLSEGLSVEEEESVFEERSPMSLIKRDHQVKIARSVLSVLTLEDVHFTLIKSRQLHGQGE